VETSVGDLLKFRTSVSEADFLFNHEIPKYLDQIFERGWSLLKLQKQYRSFNQEEPEGYDHNEVVKALDKEYKWFSEQMDISKEKFKKYLDISE